MGTSTDALLYYGINLCEPDGESGLKSEIFKKLNLTDQIELSLYDYFEGLGDGVGVTFDTHCYHESPAWFVTTAYKRAWRGSPVNVRDIVLGKADEIHPYLEWNHKLKVACEVIGFEYVEPQWWLASYWG